MGSTHIIQSSLDLQWRLLLWEALGAGCVGPVALWQSARGQPFCYCKVFWGVLQGVQPAGACVWGFGRGPVCAWSVVPKGDVDSPPLRFSCGHFFVASDTIPTVELKLIHSFLDGEQSLESFNILPKVIMTLSSQIKSRALIFWLLDPYIFLKYHVITKFIE